MTQDNWVRDSGDKSARTPRVVVDKDAYREAQDLVIRAREAEKSGDYDRGIALRKQRMKLLARAFGSI